jgi:hypothetical protein
MNIWTEKSIQLAETNYLDNLENIYPNNINERRFIDLEVFNKIWSNLKSNSDENSLKDFILFLEYEDLLSPIDNLSDIRALKNINEISKALENNNNRFNAIIDSLLKLSYDEILDKITKPKDSSRQNGQKFINFIKKFFNLKSERELLNSNEDGIFLLDGTDADKLKFAQQILKLDYDKKGFDLLCKITKNNNKIFVIGEAKYIRNTGGSQDKSFEEINYLIKSKSNDNVIKIAIIDGFAVQKKNYLKNKIEKHKLKEYNIMSVLLLNEFLTSTYESL